MILFPNKSNEDNAFNSSRFFVLFIIIFISDLFLSIVVLLLFILFNKYFFFKSLILRLIFPLGLWIIEGIFIELSLIGDNFNNNDEFSLSDFIIFFFGVIFL